jgi:hypothetical protein
MDLSKLPIRAGVRSKATSPEEIFASLTLRGTVENIYGPQAEALKLWDHRRAEGDNIIEMAIGGGKTLVGLLIAKSIVNETRRKVLYVCPNNQLVEQTVERATECGIEIATYYGRHWTGADVYDEATGPCITNYAAVFNGFSIFQSHDIAAVVFDDAHVASHEVRKAFTLKLSRDHGAFRPIADLFREHFARNSKTHQLENALTGDARALLFVPMFEVARAHEHIRKILIAKGVRDDDTRYAWEHLNGRLSRCVLLISGAGIEITPPVLPIDRMRYFESDVRRIYLTATLPSRVEFVRTFGVASVTPIVPTGKLGTAQRQIQFLPGDSDEKQREFAKDLIADVKACVIAPSGAGADGWCPPGRRFDGRDGHAAIKAFAGSKDPQKLVLAGRYDGIDLPDRACKVLVLDDLPRGESLFDRFIDQGLRIERLRVAHMATRITQAMGRIFRNNRDHGAVLVCGTELQRWLRDPAHQQYVPPLLQQQLQFGLELRRLVDEKKTDFGTLLTKVLDGHKDWDRLYAANVETFETGAVPAEPQWLIELTLRERTAYWKLWNDDCPRAASEYAEVALAADQYDTRLAAWYRHWVGLADQLAGDTVGAAENYIRAANERGELGRPPMKDGLLAVKGGIRAGAQSVNIAALLAQGGRRLRGKLDGVRAALVNGPDTSGVEQALRDLGEMLGLQSTRPEREVGTGPDTLWRHAASKSGAALEAKTNKKATSQYQKKDDVGQFHDHIEWLKGRYPGETFEHLIIGPHLMVSSETNPPESLRVVEVEEFALLAGRLRQALEFVENTGLGIDLAVRVEQALGYYGLLWPACIDGLQSRLAIDLKADISGVADSN